MTTPWLIECAKTLHTGSADPQVHPWLTETARREAAGLPGCATHPSGHQHTLIPVQWPENDNGKLWGFDAAAYLNTYGYCMGDDDVSRTLIRVGQWEPVESRAFERALAHTPGLVLDFGAQIGWYTIMAARMGREVLAIEAVAEHCGLIRQNALLNEVAKNVTIAQCWIDDNTPELVGDFPPIAMVKIDLEGNDAAAYRVIRPAVKAGQVAAILCEISPVFNDSYVELVRDIIAQGFTAEVCNPWRPLREDDDLADFVNAEPQTDMLFVRKP